jgi:aminopeptidase 2
VQDKDVSKFNLALDQALDSIRANAVWLETSETDIRAWLAGFEKRKSAQS